MSLDRNTVVDVLEESEFFGKEGWRTPKKALDLGATSWLPDYVSKTGLMYVLTSNRIPGFVERRLRKASEKGHDIYVVAEFESISDRENIDCLSQVDASIVWIGDDDQANHPQTILKTLAEQEIAIEPTLRQSLFEKGLQRCNNATSSHQKGKRLEDLLHFMFAQIPDFRVLKCNYRTQTEELDCVIQVTSYSGRSWAILGAPHIIVEAKNRALKTGQGTVSKLCSIMKGKRKTCRIGMIVSLSGFTSDARDQVLRLSTKKNILVLITNKDLRQWGTSSDYEDALEKQINHAMLN